MCCNNDSKHLEENGGLPAQGCARSSISVCDHMQPTGNLPIRISCRKTVTGQSCHRCKTFPQGSPIICIAISNKLSGSAAKKAAHGCSHLGRSVQDLGLVCGIIKTPLNDSMLIWNISQNGTCTMAQQLAWKRHPKLLIGKHAPVWIYTRPD